MARGEKGAADALACRADGIRPVLEAPGHCDKNQQLVCKAIMAGARPTQLGIARATTVCRAAQRKPIDFKYLYAWMISRSLSSEERSPPLASG